MDYRRLGRTDVKLSAICLGTMTWGQQNSEAEGFAQMDYALAEGVNCFDTAELYSIPPKPDTQGSTETIIGNYFAARGNRNKVFLASKVCGDGENTWFRDDKAPTSLTRKQMSEALDKSLKRLKSDHIDLYQLHWPARKMPWGSTPTQFKMSDFSLPDTAPSILSQLEVLDGFIKAGKIRFIGLSNESAWGTMKFLVESESHGLPRVQSVQNAYNLLNRTYETDMAEVSLREDVGLLAYSPLAQGYLSGKYLDGALPAGSRTTLFKRGQRYQKPGAEEAIRDYMAVARDFGLDPAAFANAYVTSRCFVTSNIIGATSMAQLKTAIGSAHIRITPEMETRIDAVHQLRGNPAP